MVKQRLLLIFLLLISFSIFVSSSDNICTNPIRPDTSCLFITPSLNCSNYTYKIIDSNSSLVKSGNLSLFYDDLYSFNLSLSSGHYILELCDGSTYNLDVNNKRGVDNMFSLIFVMVLIGLYFGFLGWRNDLLGLKLLGYGLFFLQLLLALGVSYAYELGNGTYINLIYLDLLITLVLGLALGIYTFTMSTVSMVSFKQKDGWGKEWR